LPIAATTALEDSEGRGAPWHTGTNSSFSVQVMDVNGDTDTKLFDLTINP